MATKKICVEEYFYEKIRGRDKLRFPKAKNYLAHLSKLDDDFSPDMESERRYVLALISEGTELFRRVEKLLREQKN